MITELRVWSRLSMSYIDWTAAEINNFEIYIRYFLVLALVHVGSADAFQDQLPCFDATVVLVLLVVSRNYMVRCDSSRGHSGKGHVSA
jgi:hypothetical protein